MRTLQFVRAPSVLLDYSELENAIGGRLSAASAQQPRLSVEIREWMYRIGFERGYFDAILNDYCVRPFQSLLRWCDVNERRWVAFLSYGETGAGRSHEAPPSLEEML